MVVKAKTKNQLFTAIYTDVTSSKKIATYHTWMNYKTLKNSFWPHFLAFLPQEP